RRTLQLLQSDLPLRPIHDLVGNARVPAPLPVLGPRLRQKQLGINQALVRATRYTQMDRDDTVVGLARSAAPLALHAGRFRSLLGGATFVHDADGAQVISWLLSQLSAHMLLQQIPYFVLSPLMVLEKLLQGADGHPSGQGDGFDTLACQVGKQSPAI